MKQSGRSQPTEGYGPVAAVRPRNRTAAPQNGGMRAALVIVVGALVAGPGLLAGCTANQPRSAAAVSPTPAVTTPAVPASTAPARPRLPSYVSTVRPVTATRLGPSWHRGCPVGPRA